MRNYTYLFLLFMIHTTQECRIKYKNACTGGFTLSPPDQLSALPWQDLCSAPAELDRLPQRAPQPPLPGGFGQWESLEENRGREENALDQSILFIPLSSTPRGHHRLSHHQRPQLFSSFEKMTALGMVTALLFLTPGHHIVSEVSTQPAYSLVNY